MIDQLVLVSRIVYFVEAYFNERDYQRFGIKIFENNGFHVEVWDFTPFIAPDAYKRANEPPAFSCVNWRLFQTRSEAKAAIAKLDSTWFVISLIHFSPKSLFVHRMLFKQHVKYCVDTMALPTVDRSGIAISKKFSDKFKQLKMDIVLNKIVNSVPYWMLNVRCADFVLGRGEHYGTSGLAVTDKTEVVWTHSYDYDIYLEEKDLQAEVDVLTGVFIDEYLPFHPDYTYSGHKVPVTADQYYPKLCRFFDYLETQYGFRIIIAAHPRSRYEEFPDFFEGRPVIRGKTPKLVQTSGFVIIHTSTAINFAVLYKKPIIVITTDKYNEGWTEDPTPDWLAGFFGKKTHNLDYPLELDLQKELIVDETAYSLYRNAYIKKQGTEDLPSWQILANRVSEIR